MIFRETEVIAGTRVLLAQVELGEKNGIATVEYVFHPYRLARAMERWGTYAFEDLDDIVLRSLCISPMGALSITDPIERERPGSIEIIHQQGAADLGSTALGYTGARLHIPGDPATELLHDPMLSDVHLGLRTLKGPYYHRQPGMVHQASVQVLDTTLHPPAFA